MVAVPYLGASEVVIVKALSPVIPSGSVAAIVALITLSSSPEPLTPPLILVGSLISFIAIVIGSSVGPPSMPLASKVTL